VARSRLIAAFSDFLKPHPERNQGEFYPVARDALKTVFPCQAGLVRGRRHFNRRGTIWETAHAPVAGVANVGKG
jgi:hypothetical protein